MSNKPVVVNPASSIWKELLIRNLADTYREFLRENIDVMQLTGVLTYEFEGTPTSEQWKLAEIIDTSYRLLGARLLDPTRYEEVKNTTFIPSDVLAKIATACGVEL